jgi:glycerol-3-phosphate cytidylyltransferase
MFHIGHLNLIRRAKERCGRLIVGVLSDESVLRGKKKWPVIPLPERMEIVSSLKYVDETDVTTQELLNKITAWNKYRFDAMFSGDDHASDGWTREEADLKVLGADLVFFPYTKEVSTSFLQSITLPPKAESADKAKKVKGGFRHLFPFDKVKKGERIIIYGAGDVGAQYARQLSALDFCEIAAFADTYAKKGDMTEGIRCLTPGELDEGLASYDRIVIASTTYHSQITERLRSLGVPPERIV